MWFRIDLSGIELQIQIKHYEPSVQDRWDCQWCDVDFSFQSGTWLQYKKEDDEVLLSCEVEELADLIDGLLNDRISDVKEVAMIEPDFVYVFHPKRDLRLDPKYTYVREGYEIADIYLEWKVFFWNEGLTDNYLRVVLDRQEMEYLRNYLWYIMGKLKFDSPEIKELVEKNMLYRL